MCSSDLRDFVFVQDVVAANLLALDYPQAGVFNIGTGRETTILSIYLKLQELAASPLNPVHGPPKAGEQRRSALDCRQAREKLHWAPKVDLAEGLAHTLTAFRAGGGGGCWGGPGEQWLPRLPRPPFNPHKGLGEGVRACGP